jgi:hypothetical protein
MTTNDSKSFTVSDSYDGPDPIRRIEVGGPYAMENEEIRHTDVKVDGTILTVHENLWESDDFETEYEWQVTTRELFVAQYCDTKSECFQSVMDQSRVMKAMAALDYEFERMMEDGVALWRKPAIGRE